MAENRKFAKDQVKHGSERHAHLLGLRLIEKDEKVEFQHEGYTLIDPTQWGPNARPEFIRSMLIQKVRELQTPPEVPVNGPTMWTPHPAD